MGSASVEPALSHSNRCSRCRGETVPVSVDAGAGSSLPLFVVGQPVPTGAGRVVQVIRQPLEGQLCLNCGWLSAEAKLSRSEIDEYQEQAKILAQPGGQAISSRSPTWIKRPRQ